MSKSGIIRAWGWVRMLKNDGLLLYYAWRHPETPPYIKSLMIIVLAYFFSPIDVIPDYFPMLGLLDDAVIVPSAIFYLVHLLPENVKTECKEKGKEVQRKIPIVIALIMMSVIAWIILIIVCFKYLFSG